MGNRTLSTQELFILLAILQLGDDAYGVSIANAVAEARGKAPSIPAIYIAIDRLEDDGLVKSEVGEPEAMRGGRAKRYVRLTPKGIRAVRDARQALTRLWSNIPALADDGA
jgi:PadR family transcriptional regulator, regulatory protein PadR